MHYFVLLATLYKGNFVRVSFGVLGVLGFLTVSQFSFGFFRPDSKEEVVLQKLRQQVTIFNNAIPLVERPELGRYIRLSKVAEAVIEKLDDSDKGALHPETGRALRKYAIVFAKAETFLKRVKTARTAGEIQAIIQIAKEITDALQIAEPLYTYNTQAVLDELIAKINDALSLNPSKHLRSLLETLKFEDIPRIRPKSSTGDHFETYKTTIPFCQKIRGNYPVFYSVPADSPLFNVLLDIQGINEEFIEFAKLEKELSKIGDNK